jgi:uncharacterized damage-inducible protein DinB
MKALLTVIALLCLCAAPGFGQTIQTELLNDWKAHAKQLIETAEAMPADKYDYKPSKEVYSFGEQVKHIAGTMVLLLGWVNGKDTPAGEDSFAALKTKEEILAALRQTFADGEATIGKLTEKSGAEVIDARFFGKTSRHNVIINPLLHNNAHYGQMVVYLRLNGIVPPASRR